jgi:hypothetical protein
LLRLSWRRFGLDDQFIGAALEDGQLLGMSIGMEWGSLQSAGPRTGLGVFEREQARDLAQRAGAGRITAVFVMVIGGVAAFGFVPG